MYRFDLEKEENILKKGTANLSVDRESFSGALYLTNKRLVFVGYLHGAAHKYEKAFSLKQISELKEGRTLFIIPNMFQVRIDGDEYELVVHGRNEWLDAIRKEIAAC